MNHQEASETATKMQQAQGSGPRTSSRIGVRMVDGNPEKWEVVRRGTSGEDRAWDVVDR